MLPLLLGSLPRASGWWAPPLGPGMLGWWATLPQQGQRESRVGRGSWVPLMHLGLSDARVPESRHHQNWRDWGHGPCHCWCLVPCVWGIAAVWRPNLCVLPPLLLRGPLELLAQYCRGHGVQIASTTSAVLPIPPPLFVPVYLCSDVQMCGSLQNPSVLDQRNLCWVMNVLLIVDWRGETNRLSHTTMILTSPLIFFFPTRHVHSTSRTLYLLHLCTFPRSQNDWFLSNIKAHLIWDLSRDAFLDCSN